MSLIRSILILAILSSSGCISRDNKTVEITSDSQNEILKAERFTLARKDGYTLLNIINPWQGATGLNQTYFLVKRGEKIPSGLDSSAVIFVPLKKIICMSTTHAAMISSLGEESSVRGMSGTGLLYDKTLIQNAKKGLIADVGYEANLNKELILKISPDVIMIYGIGGESAGYMGKVKELGVTVIFNADYLETDPLGKAEWIKVLGALYCKDEMADSIYCAEAENYDNLKTSIARKIRNRPKVLLGLPFKDTWYISPGNSFISKLINDAGGEYLWQDSKSAVSMPVGIENVYLRALKADFWINIGNAKSKNDISAIDPRLNELPCFKQGNLYNNINRVNPEGGNDYWESGSVCPHLILKDIASIIHPEIFSVNELFYYKKLN
jgi:iron complex transport system substrate-binding protein